MNKEIIVQVAFKGAIECVTNANTESEVKDVRSLTKLFTEIMISEIGDYKPQQAQSTSYSSSGSSKPITEKQKTLLRRLVDEAGINLDINALDVKQASEKIDELIEAGKQK
tara:strand:- start:2735 stop:3067 length:333 start_codon:yes stop_codon:yes gene_type:complete